MSSMSQDGPAVTCDVPPLLRFKSQTFALGQHAHRQRYSQPKDPIVK